jgi:ADP-heptose:LPS heptosyltransferase
LAYAGRKYPPGRSISLKTVADYLGAIDCVHFVSLQMGGVSEDMREASHRLRLIDWTSDIHDFAETAALIDNLDLVISVDTSVAHLAGAMGKPAWTLLQRVPDWRWLMDREDSPWYPTMRLFRQSTAGDWKPVLIAVATALGAMRNK